MRASLPRLWHESCREHGAKPAFRVICGNSVSVTRTRRQNRLGCSRSKRSSPRGSKGGNPMSLLSYDGSFDRRAVMLEAVQVFFCKFREGDFSVVVIRLSG
jgi:hypothetical protein